MALIGKKATFENVELGDGDTFETTMGDNGEVEYKVWDNTSPLPISYPAKEMAQNGTLEGENYNPYEDIVFAKYSTWPEEDDFKDDIEASINELKLEAEKRTGLTPEEIAEAIEQYKKKKEKPVTAKSVDGERDILI